MGPAARWTPIEATPKQTFNTLPSYDFRNTMTENQSRLCGSCLYWQPYPALEGVGICDHPVSRYYQRAVINSAEPCEYYILSKVGVHPGYPEASDTSSGQGRPT